MLPPGFTSAREVRTYYEQKYDVLIDAGGAVPFIYPWATIGFGIVILYLLVDHRASKHWQLLNCSVFAALLSFSIWSVIHTRARSAAASYGVGLLSAWGTIWVFAILIANDGQRDFCRVERHSHSAPPTSTQAAQAESKYDDERPQSYYWQIYPAKFSYARVDWVIDLFTNFRGIGWSFEVAGIPPPPLPVQSHLDKKHSSHKPTSDVTVSKIGIRRLTDRSSLLKAAGSRFLIACLMLDVIKLLMTLDPYFWGYTMSPAPNYLPSVFHTSAVLLKVYRLLTALGALYFGLSQVFSLGPLFFACIVGPHVLGLRGAAWMNPPDFYGGLRAAADKGLAGWWGGFWHQTFRFGFEAPATAILKWLGVEKRSQLGRLIGVFVAFGLSGTLHAMGSHTQLGDTRPIRGPLCFFLLQAVGMTLQNLVVNGLKSMGLLEVTPKLLRQVANFVFTHVWLYFTAPLLVEDFAHGGVWLYEPLLVSPLRMLGLAGPTENGYDLWYGLVFWRSGKHWWDTGIAF